MVEAANEASALREQAQKLTARVQELEQALGAAPGEDAQIAVHRATEREFERGLQASQAEIVRLEERVEQLLDANNRELAHRRRVQATVKLMRDVVSVIGEVELRE